MLTTQNAFERERWMAHQTLGLLLTAQRALKREKYGLTRPLAHSSESVQKRERLAHKASDLNQTVLTTVKHALTVLNIVLACFNSVKHINK